MADSQTIRDNLGAREGNNPDRQLRSPNLNPQIELLRSADYADSCQRSQRASIGVVCGVTKWERKCVLIDRWDVGLAVAII